MTSGGTAHPPPRQVSDDDSGEFISHITTTPVEPFRDERKVIIEVKNPALMDSPSVLRKESAAREWHRRRGMTYELATIY